MSKRLKMTKDARDYKRIAVALGATVVNCTKNGHYHLTLEHRGQTKLFSFASSGSDQRGIKNYRAEVKRWMEGSNAGKTKSATYPAREAGARTHPTGV